ncbi:sensor histidine kinase [Halanaeroarchaeum sulfurireducens]|uniref:histidine kinase n=1 Tax=Halanaeroarchaeum sulfurireducens TaxID=1604004 RepID=A0A0F7PCI3_9EURY|nr:GAF domain-containing sensor histidine kinase [Halanaeroarchaeum sulfurireducens]AKH98407.1 GAF sensor signal transduction histidine kinase [Halanaeroarchaeum sulfurireducens]ALG82801.1 GAF sensor signal transduction histidine kinase [Halanaeroarchaeum sulfurireducens]
MTAESGPSSGLKARRKLYDLMRKSLSRTELMDQILDIGAEYLGANHGFVSDIDVSDNRWEIIASTDGPDGPYPEGLVEELGTTLCRHTIDQGEPLALHDVPGQGFEDDIAYQRHGMDLYHGAAIRVRDEIFGTICFVSGESRDEPFTETEVWFVELAAQLLGQALERTHHERQILNRERLIDVLNRVLRHNLRNDMNVIIGSADLIEEQTTGENQTLAAQISETGQNLMELAETARNLEELCRSVPVPRPMDIRPLVDAAVAGVKADQPDASISVTGPDEIVALAAPQLESAVKELLENAANDGGTNPHIEVTIEREDSVALVTVTDSGSGLPDAERMMLESGEESAVEHGSGLGLFLVHWIVTNLDGNIDVVTSDGGSSITIQLPTARIAPVTNS